jgi:cytochrome bd ubiquinol oxidase subunit II
MRGLTVDQAAAGDATLVALTIAVTGGAIVLTPSLALLFRLSLQGGFDPGRAASVGPATRSSSGPRARLVAPGVLLVAASTLTVMLDSTAGPALGVVALLAFVTLAFGPLAIPREWDGWAASQTIRAPRAA